MNTSKRPAVGEMIAEDIALLSYGGSAEREGMINPGDFDWFPSADFGGYLWGFSDRVIVSLIISKNPGKGNLSKLFNAIWATGRTVAVPTPFAHMRAILERNGFRQTFDEGCEVWVKPATAKAEGRS